MQARYGRLEQIIGSNNINILSTKTVLVLGVGGVGGYVVESLVRSDIGTIIIVDFDIIDESNINRQIIALESTINMKKVDVLEKRINDINPDCKVIKIDKFIDNNNIQKLFDYKIDFFVDACDTISVKKEVIKICLTNKIPFISSMGTGNKLDPSQLEIVDIRKTINDPIAKILRKFIKDEKITSKVLVCTSKELPIKVGTRTPGSSAFVPASAGLLIGSYILKYFIK